MEQELEGMAGKVCGEGGKPKSRLIAMKNKLRQKQKAEAQKPPLGPDNGRKTTADPENVRKTTVRREESLSRPAIKRHPSIKPRSRTVDNCLSETGNSASSQEALIGVPPAGTSVKRSQSVDTVDVTSEMKKFIRRDNSSYQSTKLAKGSYINMAASSGVNVRGTAGKENVYGTRSGIPISPRGSTTRQKPPLGTGIKRTTSADERSKNAKPPPNSSLYRVHVQRSLESVRPEDCRSKVTGSHDNISLQQQNRLKNGQTTLELNTKSSVGGSHGNLGLQSMRPQPMPGSHGHGVQQSQANPKVRGNYISGSHEQISLPPQHKRVLPSYTGASEPYKMATLPAYHKISQDWPASSSAHHQPSMKQFRSSSRLANTKRFSRSLDDLTESKAQNPAEVSALSAESDPISQSADVVNDYLREWAVQKPKAVLMSSKENLRGEPEKQNQKESFLQKMKDTKSIGENQQEFHPEIGKSHTLDGRKGRFPFIRRGSGSNNGGDKNKMSGNASNAQISENKMHGSDPNLYIHEPRVTEGSQVQQVKGQGFHQRAFSLKLTRKQKADNKSAGGKPKSNLRVTNPDDAKFQRTSQDGSTGGSGTTMATGRRHTVTVGEKEARLENQRDLGVEKAMFLEHLAKKFPDHASRIKDGTTELERPPSQDRQQQSQRRGVSHHGQHPSQGRPTSAGDHPGRTDHLSRSDHHARSDHHSRADHHSSHPRPVPAGGEARPQHAHNGDPPRVPPQHGPLPPHEAPDHSPTGTFARGGRLRSSLPIVRSPNKSLDRPLGLIFLTFRNETKRALLPNEVTSLDTVKALFVRSFSDTLSMQWFEIAGHKVYILDPNTNVFYELEDIRDVKDRSVLKVYEPDHPHGPPPSPGPHSPHTPDYLALHCHHGNAAAGYDSDTSARSAPTGGSTTIRSPLHHPPLSPRLYGHHQVPGKTQTLPSHVQNTYACPQQVKAAAAAAYGTATYAQVPAHLPHQAPPPQGSHWSPTSHRSNPAAAPPPSNLSGSQFLHPSHSNQSSPQRGTQRHSLAYIPDNAGIYQDARSLPQSRSYHDYHEGASGHASGSATPTHGESNSKARMDHMEAQLANLTAWVQTTVMKTQSEAGSRPGSARSNSSVVSEGSYSAKSKSESTTPQQSPTASSTQGMSDISSATPQPVISLDMQTSLRRLHQQAKDLRNDVTKLRRLQVTNMETVREEIHNTYVQLKDVISTVPGAHSQPLRARRCQVDTKVSNFRAEAERVQKDLTDLETSVEELRNDVLHRKCRINMTEIENMALALSTITKALGDLKAHFPALQGDMKTVMQGEMEVVVQEEKMLREEPDKLESSLKRCKKLTGTLATMRRLGLVQEHKSPSAPEIVAASPKDQDRKAVLDSIKAVIPNHEARYTSVQAAEESRERKKKIDTKGEALRFEKSLALAQKQLKETTVPADGSKRGSVTAETPPAVTQSSDGGKAEGLDTSSPRTSLLSPSTTCPPTPLSPTSTSTPKSHANTYTTSAELSSTSTSSTPGNKKVPPPPPPRKSSQRVIGLMSPKATNQAEGEDSDRPPSPHMYENIEKLNIILTPGKERPKSTSDVELAQSPEDNEAPSSSSSTASLDSQLGGGTGTIRRNKNYVGESTGVNKTTNGVTTTASVTTSVSEVTFTNTASMSSTNTLEQKAARKIPPPPPQRKTSVLTQQAQALSQPQSQAQSQQGKQPQIQTKIPLQVQAQSVTNSQKAEEDQKAKNQKTDTVSDKSTWTKLKSGGDKVSYMSSTRAQTQEKTYKYRVGHNGGPPNAINSKLVPNGDSGGNKTSKTGSKPLPAAVIGPRGFEETDIY